MAFGRSPSCNNVLKKLNVCSFSSTGLIQKDSCLFSCILLVSLRHDLLLAASFTCRRAARWSPCKCLPFRASPLGWIAKFFCVFVLALSVVCLVQVSAELTPESESRVAVKFKQFKLLNTISVNAPDSARGWLDTTYLDSEMRVSRGDKGEHLMA